MKSTPTDVGEGSPLRLKAATKEAVLTFAVWMAGVSMTSMWVAVLYAIFDGPRHQLASLENVLELLHKAMTLGWLAGSPAAFLASLIIHDRATRLPPWSLLITSMVVTLTTGALICLVLHQAQLA